MSTSPDVRQAGREFLFWAALAPVIGTVLILVCAQSGTLAHWLLAARGPVMIGLISYSAYLWLPEFVRYLSSADPEIGIEVVAAASRNTLACLHDRTVDLIQTSEEGHLHEE